MNETRSLVLVTTIAPDPENSGGPSGLPWEIIEVFKRDNWDVHVQVIRLPSGSLRRRLMQLSMPLGTLDIEKKDASVYIFYPFYLGRRVPRELHGKTILLGPDASSLLYARFARIERGWRRWRARCISRWFICQERWASRNLASIAVVGFNDMRWLQRFTDARTNHVAYIPHPILRNVARAVQNDGREAPPRLILGGDLAPKYVGDFFETLDYTTVSQMLNAAKCEVLVVGRGNRRLHDTLIDHLPSKYIPWIDDYATLCDPLRDIHAVPLMAGAGTKNRTLTALAMNVILVSSAIGTENIDPAVLRAATVHRFRSSSDFTRALSLALRDLQARRIIGLPPPPPPVDRITQAFEENTRRLAKAVATHSISEA